METEQGIQSFEPLYFCALIEFWLTKREISGSGYIGIAINSSNQGNKLILASIDGYLQINRLGRALKFLIVVEEVSGAVHHDHHYLIAQNLKALDSIFPIGESGQCLVYTLLACIG